MRSVADRLYPGYHLFLISYFLPDGPLEQEKTDSYHVDTLEHIYLFYRFGYKLYQPHNPPYAGRCWGSRFFGRGNGHGFRGLSKRKARESPWYIQYGYPTGHCSGYVVRYPQCNGGSILRSYLPRRRPSGAQRVIIRTFLVMLGGAWGSYAVGIISDALGGGAPGLRTAIIIATAFGIIGGGCFLMASRHYIADAERASRDKLLTAS